MTSLAFILLVLQKKQQQINSTFASEKYKNDKRFNPSVEPQQLFIQIGPVRPSRDRLFILTVRRQKVEHCRFNRS